MKCPNCGTDKMNEDIGGVPTVESLYTSGKRIPIKMVILIPIMYTCRMNCGATVNILERKNYYLKEA